VGEHNLVGRGSPYDGRVFAESVVALSLRILLGREAAEPSVCSVISPKTVAHRKYRLGALFGPIQPMLVHHF
jgi:hypothetical protein